MLVSGLAAALTAVPAWPAAANPRGGCPLGRICLYGDRGFTGNRQDLDGGQAGSCTPAATPVWSAVNRSGPRAGTAAYRLHLFRGSDCSQPAATVAPDASREDTAGSRSWTLECTGAAACR